MQEAHGGVAGRKGLLRAELEWGARAGKLCPYPARGGWVSTGALRAVLWVERPALPRLL